MTRGIIALFLVTSFMPAEAVPPACCTVTGREIVVDQGVIKVKVNYIDSDHSHIDRKNSLLLSSLARGQSKDIYSLEACATEDLFWDGNAFRILIGDKKLICLIVKDSWDGEDPRSKDLIIITDGNLVVELRPSMGVDIDYSHEVAKAYHVFDKNLADGNLSADLVKQVESIRLAAQVKAD
jgi:hypothetical protein